MRKYIDIANNRSKIGSLLILIFSISYLRHSLTIQLDPTAVDIVFTPRTMPIGLATISILCALFQLFFTKENHDVPLWQTINKSNWKPLLALIALMTIYALCFNFLGFVIGSILFLLAGFYVLGERRIILSLSIAIGLIGFLWLLLSQVFGLYLDNGHLIRFLLGTYKW